MSKFQTLRSRIDFYVRMAPRPALPEVIFIEPSSYCNFKCTSCPQHEGLKREHGFMSVENFDRITDDIVALYAEQGRDLPWLYPFLGGESLMHKQFVTLLKMAKAKGFRCNLTTNGFLLGNELAESLVDCGLDVVTVSFNGGDTRQGYEDIYGANKYDRVLANVARLAQVRRDKGAAAPAILLSVRKAVDKYGAYEIEPAFEQEARRKGVDKVIGGVLESFGGQVENDTVRTTPWGGHYFPCLELWTRLVIGWNGDVYLCCVDISGTVKLGNVLEQGIAGVWYGEPFMEVRRRQIAGYDRDMPLCSACPALWHKEKMSLYRMARTLEPLFRSNIDPLAESKLFGRLRVAVKRLIS